MSIGTIIALVVIFIVGVIWGYLYVGAEGEEYKEKVIKEQAEFKQEAEKDLEKFRKQLENKNRQQ